jgi:ATP-dependent DNA helicase RecG
MKRVPELAEIPDELTVPEFWDLFGDVEHEHLDFKVRPDNLTDVFPSMAMTDGGMVVVGVRDDRNLVGCTLNQRTLDAITNASHATGVDVVPREILVDKIPITLVAVPEIRGRITTTPDGRLLRRVGGQSQPLVGDALARFVRERENRSAEDDPMAAAVELDMQLLNQALRGAGRGRARREQALRALVDLGVARQELPPAGPVMTKAAVLLFGRDPRALVNGATVQIVRREGVGPGPGPTTARVELSGPIPSLLDEVLAFVNSQAPRVQLVIGTRREVLPAYPEPALREVVLNALAHRDYSLSGATVDVTIWNDRIEFKSPGGLPGHITVDNIRDEHYSRNRRLMAGLKSLGLVEEYGEGIDRMFAEMESRLMDPPTIVATATSVTVTLYTRSLAKPEDQAWLSVLGHLGLTPAERRVLVIARREGSVTPRKIRAALVDVDPDQILDAAMAKGLLVRIGERGGSRYVLSDEIVMRIGSSALEARSRQRQILLDEVRRRGSLTVQEGAEHLRENPRLVRHLMNDLASLGQVTAHGRTRGRRFYPPGGMPR